MTLSSGRKRISATMLALTTAPLITAAAGSVAELCVPSHRPENTWINIVNAPDGGWGIGGQQYTGDQLIAEATAAAN